MAYVFPLIMLALSTIKELNGRPRYALEKDAVYVLARFPAVLHAMPGCDAGRPVIE